MSNPFGAQLASATTGVAVDCGAKWLRGAIDLAVATLHGHRAQGDHPGTQRHRLPGKGRVHRGRLLG